MVIDEVSVYSQLASAPYGALVQAVSVMGEAFDARVAAGRLVDVPFPTPHSYVHVSQVPLPNGASAAMQDWPLGADSVFGYFHKKGWADLACRPRQQIDELQYAQLKLYQPIDAFVQVVDSLCATIPIHAGGWAMICLLRCGDQNPFDDQAVKTIDRFRPAMANLFNGKTLTGDSSTQASGTVTGTQTSADSTEELLAKLTPTERSVLQHLRTGITEREIGNKMHRSPHTIHVHVKNIYRKLDVSSRSQLMEKLDSM